MLVSSIKTYMLLLKYGHVLYILGDVHFFSLLKKEILINPLAHVATPFLFGKSSDPNAVTQTERQEMVGAYILRQLMGLD